MTTETGPNTNQTPSAMVVLIAILIVAALAALGFSIGFQVSSIERSLSAATWGLFAVIVLWIGSALIWGSINQPASAEPDLSDRLRSGANVVITVDGVLLGLVYTFAGLAKTPIPLVVRTGSLALVVGVVLALLLYSLVAGKITTYAAIAVSTGLFSLSSWASIYGLLCIVFALVLPS
jgi:hypothetical protein